MNKNITLLTLLFLVFSQSVFSQLNYKVIINGDALIKNINGNKVNGESNVRVTLYGENDQKIIGGKLCYGSFSVINLKDEPDIGKVIGVDIELQGKGWTEPVKIYTINVKKEDPNGSGEGKKFNFSFGMALTQGNSLAQIDKGGAIGFVEAEVKEAEVQLDGDFTTEDYVLDRNGVKIEVTHRNGKTDQKTQSKTTSPDANDPKRMCTTEVVEANATFNENFILNTNATNIYPGGLFYAQSIPSGSFNQYASGIDRNPITITTDLAIADGDPSIEILNPDISTVRNGLNTMLVRRTKGGFQNNYTFEVSDISSMQELALAVGASVESASFDANLKASLNSGKSSNIKMVKFKQVFYTVSVVPPRTPGDFFKNKKLANEVLSSGKTPLYVDAVIYGRVAYFFMETSASFSDIKLYLDGTYKGAAKVNANLDLKIKEELSKIKYSGTVIGGGLKQITSIDGFEGFMQQVRDGGTLDQTELAVPIGYTCKFLADNSIANVNLFSTFTKKNCVEVKSDIVKARFKLESVKYTDGSKSEIRFGYAFSAYKVATPTFKENKLITSEVAWNDATVNTDYRTLKKGGELNIAKFSEPFMLSVKENTSGTQKIIMNAWVNLIDFGWANQDYKSPVSQQTFLLKDIMSLNSLDGKSSQKVLKMNHEGCDFEFVFSIELIE